MSQAADAGVLEPARRRIASYAGFSLFLAGFIASLPTELPDFATLTTLGVVAMLFGVTLRYCILSRQPLLGTLIVLYLGAYMPGMGNALTQGISPRSPDLPVSADAVGTAVMILLGFLAAVVLSTGLFRMGWVRLIPPSGALNPAWESSVGVGVTIMLLVSMVAAFRAGSWTAYGARINEDALQSTFKLEYFYEPLLVGWFMLFGRRLIAEFHKKAGERKTTLLSILLGVVFFLIFIRQMRRLMVTALVLLTLELIDFPGIARRVLASPSRILAVAALIGSLVLGVFWGSEAWRRSALEFSTNSIVERLDDIVTRSSEERSGDENSVNNVRTRLTYLWIDAAAIQYDHVVGGSLTIEDLLVRTSILVLPKIVFRAKYMYPVLTCETAFMRLGLSVDLPCTSQSEGFIAGGWAGVFGIGVTFGFILSAAAVMIQRGRGLWLIAAVQLMLPLGTLEQGAFPTILALRSSLLGTVAVASIALIFSILFAGRLRVVSQNTKTARERRLMQDAARATHRAPVR